MTPAGLGSIRGMKGRWWIAHTKPRCEKALAWDLVARDVGFFLPMISRQTQSSGRKRTSHVPLFPSYVFFCGEDDARIAALSTKRLCQVLPVLQQDLLREELATLETALRGGGVQDLYPRLEVGRKHRVTAGPFKGLEGVLVESGDRRRFVLFVSMLGQGALMDIHADFLEPAE